MLEHELKEIIEKYYLKLCSCQMSSNSGAFYPTNTNTIGQYCFIYFYLYRDHFFLIHIIT